MTPDSTCNPNLGLCPDVVKHEVRIDGLDKATTRLESRLNALILAALGSLATSTGTLLVLLLKR